MLIVSVAACIAVLGGCGQNASDTDQPSPPAGDDATSRTVQHAFGDSTIPADPQRVALLDGDRTLEAVVALGVDPVAAVKPPLTGDYSTVVRGELDSEPIDIGTSGSGVNIEALVTAEPDLIVMHFNVENSREVYDQVQSIAPTVVVEYTEAGWKDTLGQIAEFLGATESAGALIEEYDADIATARETLDTDGVTLTVARVRTNTVRYMTQNGSFPYSVLADLGYRAPAQQDPGSDEVTAVNVSPELLDVLAADRIIVLTDAGAGDAAAALQQNSLFTSIDADVTSLPSKDYLFGSVLTARNLIDAATAQ